MTQKSKLYARILGRPTPKDIRFEQLERFMLDHGFVCEGKRGSHRVFYIGDVPVTVPVPHGREPYVKPIYIKKVREAWEMHRMSSDPDGDLD